MSTPNEISTKLPINNTFKIILYICLAIIILAVLGLTSWGIYYIVTTKNNPVTQPPTTNAPTNTPTKAPVTQAPVTQSPVTQSPVTQAPNSAAPTSNPDVSKMCGPGTKPVFDSQGVATSCVLNPIALSEFSPKIDNLINTSRILPINNVATYVTPSETVIPNIPNEEVKPWYASWMFNGGETCTKTISYDNGYAGVGCACGDCAGWRGGTAINCSGNSLNSVDSEHRVYCTSMQNNSVCACADGYCPMGGLCVHPFKPRIPGGKRGCPSCITKRKSQGGCAGIMVCDPNEPLIENLVEYPGKRYECKLDTIDNDYYYAKNVLNFTSQKDMDAVCKESNEYRDVNEYECAWDCIRKYDNQEECSKKCLPKLYTWGKINVNGELQGYYQIPKLTQYLKECKTSYCTEAKTAKLMASDTDANVYLTNRPTNDYQKWRITVQTDGTCIIQSLIYGTKLKCRPADLFDSNDKGLVDRGKVSICCDGVDTSPSCNDSRTPAVYKCLQGSIVNGKVAEVTYGDKWKLVPYSESESLYYIVSDLTGFKMWTNGKGVFASKRDYPGQSNCVEIFKIITDGNNNSVFQAYVPSYNLKTCQDGKCVEKVNPVDLSVLNKCKNCTGCKWEYNSTINGFQYVCDVCQNCGPNQTSDTQCKGKVCKGCTDSTQYFQGGETGAFCEYCTQATEGCTVYNTNSIGDTQYNTGGGYIPSSYNVPRANSIVCVNYQNQSTCNGRNTNPGVLDGGIIYELGIDVLTDDSGQCNGSISQCGVNVN